MLINLPDEVIDQILGYSSEYYDVAQLWCCGDTVLNGRLSRGACTEIRWRHTTPESPTLPKILSQLQKLRLLHFSYLTLAQSLGSLSVFLRTLSPTLQDLMVSGMNAEHLLLDFRASEAGSGAWYINKTSYNEHSTHMWNVSTTFPNLRALQMPKTNFDSNFLRASDLCALPTTLETLDLANVNLNINEDEDGAFCALPRALLIFRSGPHLQEFSAKQLAGLPPNLTWLEGIYAMEADQLAQLPRTLTEGDFMKWVTSFTPEVAAALPPRIKRFAPLSIDLHSFESKGLNWIAELPKHLKGFATPLQADIPPFSADDISKLPRTLVSLLSHGIDIEDLAQSVIARNQFFRFENWSQSVHLTPPIVPFWPPKLDTIVFASERPSGLRSAADFRFLPNSITSLQNLCCESRDSLSMPQALPRSLTSITHCETYSSTLLEDGWPNKLKELSSSAPFESHTLEYLPTTLTILKIPNCIAEAQYKAKKEIKREEIEKVKKVTREQGATKPLAANYDKENIVNSNNAVRRTLPSKSAGERTKKFETKIFCEARVNEDPETSPDALYVSSMIELEPLFNPSLIELSIASMFVHHLSQLPKTLTSLKISELNGILSIEDLQCLPRELVYLELEQVIWNRNGPEIFSALPSTHLRYLSMHQTTLTGACIKYLPRTISDLHIRIAGQYDETDFSNFPPPLRMLHIASDRKLTNEEIAALPKYCSTRFCSEAWAPLQTHFRNLANEGLPLAQRMDVNHNHTDVDHPRVRTNRIIRALMGEYVEEAPARM